MPGGSQHLSAISRSQLSLSAGSGVAGIRWQTPWESCGPAGSDVAGIDGKLHGRAVVLQVQALPVLDGKLRGRAVVLQVQTKHQESPSAIENFSKECNYKEGKQ